MSVATTEPLGGVPPLGAVESSTKEEAPMVARRQSLFQQTWKLYRLHFLEAPINLLTGLYHVCIKYVTTTKTLGGMRSLGAADPSTKEEVPSLTIPLLALRSDLETVHCSVSGFPC
jgi:hypothetical protein